jgi:methyl-accepting chemotaxis protein
MDAFVEADAQLQKAADSQAMVALRRNGELDQIAARGHDLIILTLAPTLVLAAVLAFLLARSILTALVQARSTLRGIAAFANISDLRVEGFGDFAKLMREILHMRDAIERRERGNSERQLAELATETRHRRESEEAIARRYAEEQTIVVSGVAKGLAALAEGELRLRLTAAFPDAYEPLRVDFNRAIDALDAALRTIASTSSGLDANSQAVSSAVDELSRRTLSQSGRIELAAAGLREVTRAVLRSVETLGEADGLVSAARLEAERSNAVVTDTIAAMGNIQASSNKISEIVGLMDQIAFQTNLLALNAGVEAARAGESGLGFAIVAREVRALSTQSADAARQVKALISQASRHIASGVELVGHTGDALRRINNEVGLIHTIVSGIAGSGREQAQNLVKVNEEVVEIERLAQQNAATVNRTKATFAEMFEGVQTLDELVGEFAFTGVATPQISSEVIGKSRRVA